MICKNCGAETPNGKFCVKCGAELEQEINEAAEPEAEIKTEVNTAETDIASEKAEGPAEEAEEGPEEAEEKPEEAEEKPDEAEYEPKESSEDIKKALYNLDAYQAGTMTRPDEKPAVKRKFYCPKNPMLWSFLWLLAFAAILGALTAVFFNVQLDGLQIIFGITFAVFTAAVLVIDFGYYLPNALRLDRMFRGKGLKLQYRLDDDEIEELAQKAKKKNRIFYLLIALAGLAFSGYYVYILADAVVKTRLMWVSLIFSICVFVIFTALFFIMPKINYDRMKQGGDKVLIGERSVFYGGNYYHWRNIQPEATFANISTRKNELQITFTQEFKNGSTKRRRLDMYIPDRELKKGAALLKEYEKSCKAYQKKQAKNSVLNEAQDESKKEKK